MQYINELKSCVRGNKYFIYNNVGNNYYFLKKDNSKLVFNIDVLSKYRGESFKFNIVSSDGDNNGNFFVITLPNIDESYSNIFTNVNIVRPNYVSKNDKQIKYYIKSKDNRFLMNKNSCTNNECTLNPNHTIDNIIYKPEEVCRGNGNGDPNVDSNYQYSTGLITNEDPNRDRSILISQSGMCLEINHIL